MSNKKSPTVIILGRINVGKSALFNRLTETSKALVSPVPGTTRDYNLSQVNWRNKSFNLIDTGGINIDILKHSIQALISKKQFKKLLQADTIEKEIVKQTKKALSQADLILMVVDGQAGLLSEDKELALVVKKLNSPTILVCNKIDSQKYQHQINDFFKLGLSNPIPVSAINGSGTGDLLDEVVKLIKKKPGRPKKSVEKKSLKVAIIGKPNVGKSSLVNKILGEERVIVSPVPQTTREPQDTEIDYQGQKIVLIDTAGLRKKAKIEPGLEKQIAEKSIATIKKADIVLLTIEAHKMLTNQDSRLAGLLKETRVGIIIVANKWDLIGEKTPKADKQITDYYRRYFPFLNFAPIIFVAAKTGKNVEKILDLILEIQQHRQKEVSQTDLNRILKKLVKQKRPVKAKGQKRPHLLNLSQTRTNPPEFTIVIGKKQSIHFSYLRFIENQLRKNFAFSGVPIKIKVKTLK